jgi:general transcription factor 3C polypeptide 5 (transcription factor C subunit 1)
MLAELFSERPLWSKIAIGFRTRINDALLKYKFCLIILSEFYRIIMAKYAFYIMSGPWGRLWCSFGYDPRKDPNARKYQSLMVSFKRSQVG